MGNPDGDNNATCAQTTQTIQQFEGVDPEVFAEMMRIAKANVDERKRKEKEVFDAAVAKCEAVIADLDPKIAALESKIDQSADAINIAKSKRDEAESAIERSDIELAEATYQYEKVIPLKDRHDAAKKKFDTIAEDTATVNMMRTLIIKLDNLNEQYFPLDKKCDDAIATAEETKKSCSCGYNKYNRCQNRLYYSDINCKLSLNAWSDAQVGINSMKSQLGSLYQQREPIIRKIKERWDTMNNIPELPYPSDKSRFDKVLEKITAMRTESSLEFDEAKVKYLKMCSKFPEHKHKGIRSKYPGAVSTSKREYEAYKSARIQLAHLNNKLNRQRDKLDELKRQRKDAAAELESLGATV